VREAVDAAGDSGRTAVLTGWDGQARAALVIADELRPGAPAAVARIRGLGLRPVLLTGDNECVALAVARKPEIPADSVFAGVRPEGKAQVIRQMQASGLPAAFAGDGVNDAAALAQADLGMAAGTGTDAAIGAAGLTLVSGDPAGIADAIELARATTAVIRANLAWAFGYNVIAVPLAALGYLNPLFAGITMSASSLIVVANSLRLRRAGPPGRRWLAELARAAAGPVACAVVLSGLLSAWVVSGGAGTLTRVRIQITLAAVPMRAFTPQAAAAAGAAHTWLTIRNLSGTPEHSLSIR